MIEPLLILTLSEVGTPLGLPTIIIDGEVTVEVTAPRENFSELDEQFTQFGILFDLVFIYQPIDTESLLIDDQYDLLETAVSEGYYNTPKTCMLTELAGAVGPVKSTTSEKLHRTKGKVMKVFSVWDDAVVR